MGKTKQQRRSGKSPLSSGAIALDFQKSGPANLGSLLDLQCTSGHRPFESARPWVTLESTQRVERRKSMGNGDGWEKRERRKSSRREEEKNKRRRRWRRRQKRRIEGEQMKENNSEDEGHSSDEIGSKWETKAINEELMLCWIDRRKSK